MVLMIQSGGGGAGDGENHSQKKKLILCFECFTEKENNCSVLPSLSKKKPDLAKIRERMNCASGSLAASLG